MDAADQRHRHREGENCAWCLRRAWERRAVEQRQQTMEHCLSYNDDFPLRIPLPDLGQGGHNAGPLVLYRWNPLPLHINDGAAGPGVVPVVWHRWILSRIVLEVVVIGRA